MKNPHIISVKTVKIVLGLLGILLPFILIFDSIILCQEPIRDSISAYYYSNFGDVFVGILIAMATFLFSYQGYQDDNDNLITNIAAVAAILVALFPTDGLEITCIKCIMMPDYITGKIHFISAFIFFVSLSILSYVYFRKSDLKIVGSEKKKRNFIYLICSITMMGCILVIGILMLGLKQKNIFIPESIAMIAFGLSWLTKAELIFKDK